MFPSERTSPSLSVTLTPPSPSQSALAGNKQPIQRSVSLTSRCCSEDVAKKASAQHGKQTAKFLHSVSEKKDRPCFYEAVVCDQRLCLGPGGGGEDAPSPTAASIPALLERELGGTCLQMRDGWWTYELCYGGMLRQFHSEAVSDSKGKQKMVQTGENALGVFEGAGKGGKGGGTMPGPSSVVPAETWREQ